MLSPGRIPGGVLLSFLVLLPRAASAADLAILTDPSVRPYAQTVTGLRRAGGSMTEVDVRAPDAAARVRAAAPVVVVAVGQRSLALARRELSDRPIVFANVLAPDQYRLSGAVTGVPLEVGPDAQLAAIRETLPGVRRIGVPCNRTIFASFLERARRVAREHRQEIVDVHVDSIRAMPRAIDRLVGSTDALLLLPDPSLWSRETLSHVLLAGIDRRRPVVGFLDALTQSGAVMSVAPDYEAIGVRARELVDQILAQPRGAPVRVPPVGYARGRVSVNLATATRMGLRLPQVALRRVQRVFR